MKDYDFSGWATKNNIRCSDGRTIMQNAFKDNDGQKVPLVWNHQHNDAFNVLGHALLENRKEGVYAYCKLNNTESGRNAKLLIEHGDISALSIYANKLQHQGRNVVHGAIREVSLVLASANPEAYIDSVITHSEEDDEAAVIFTGEEISLYHAEEEPPAPKEETPKKEKEDMPNDNETVQDVFDTLSEKQKKVVYALIGQALEDNKGSEGDDDDMKHNLFDNDDFYSEDDYLSHAEVESIFADVKRHGSLKESVLAHGIENIDYLFPDAKNYTQTPQFIQRETGWVTKVMNGTHHTPFSRIKSLYADITGDEARARGYVKGNLKVEEVFSLLKRTTTPTTIYKKQKLDRDDVIDITDFDVVAWLKSEMRVMLDEEIARAVLVGDGRLGSDDDKINEANIRPIWTDSELYTIKKTVTVAANMTDDAKAKAFIRSAIKARKDYKGSGEPTLFTTEDVLTDCLLIEDLNGRIIYDSITKLSTTLRVKEIVPVPVFENLSRTVGAATHTLMGIIVNLNDYNIGADKGGAVNMFDDFDIDYNAQKYLIETRCSGALVKPYSAIVIESVPAATGG